MRRLRAAAVAAGLGMVLASGGAVAQLAIPAAKPLDGTTLFKQQCAVCHTTNTSDAPRQGPTLFNVVGRKAGKVEGFRYSANVAQADFVWDDSKLDAWMTNPQDVIPGSTMAYRQAKPEVRAAIVTYLKGLH